MSIELTLPFPPSTNTYIRHSNGVMRCTPTPVDQWPRNVREARAAFKKVGQWTEFQLESFKLTYPLEGLKRTAKVFGIPETKVRTTASRMGLKLDPDSEFVREWQHRAAIAKIGRKRPQHSEFMKAYRTAHPMEYPQETRLAMSARQRRWIVDNGHPRGALGMKHTDETKALIAAKSRAAAAAMTDQQRIDKAEKMLRTMRKNGTEPRNRGKATWKAGWREFGGKRCYFRSRWEANYGRYLEWLKTKGQIKDWAHEPYTFWFDKIKRGTRSYLPDFQVEECGGAVVYHEVKGWMDDRSKTKIKRMRIYFSEVRLIVIDSKGYKAISKWASALVPGWESDKPVRKGGALRVEIKAHAVQQPQQIALSVPPVLTAHRRTDRRAA
jgi:Protein of unknown function (DUF1064)